jgi:vacuolar-type H+-ATPase subunit E/Vma4
MSLAAILETVRASGEIRVREIEKQASEQAAAILDAARQEAHRVREEACSREVLPAYRERARIIHRARLEGLRLLGDVREGLVNQALDLARKRLIGLRHEALYTQVLHKLIQEALSELESSLGDAVPIRLELDPRDNGLIDTILPIIDLVQPLRIELEFNLNCWGGVIARSRDESIVVINTLESRFERALPVLRRRLSALFEIETTDALTHG